MKLLPYEIWRDIPGYEGVYQASSMGNIRALAKTVNCVLGKKHVPSKRVVPCVRLKTHLSIWGYELVRLYRNGKIKTESVHRLVAMAFIPNPNNLPCINHKDECKTNNSVSNLEWCSASYNASYGTRNKRIAKANYKPIVQLSLNNEIVRFWESASEVQKYYGFDSGNISACCLGKYGYKTAYGYKWVFYEEGD